MCTTAIMPGEGVHTKMKRFQQGSRDLPYEGIAWGSNEGKAKRRSTWSRTLPQGLIRPYQDLIFNSTKPQNWTNVLQSFALLAFQLLFSD